MKSFVVLDAHTLTPLPPGERSPHHPDWDALAALGSLTVYPRSRPDEVVSRAREAELVFTNKVRLGAEEIAALPRLSYAGVMATGTNVVDLAAARSRGIPVTNVPGYGAASVAQHVFALLLELVSRTGEAADAARRGEWSRCPDFCFQNAPTFELSGRTLGIVGFGAIGQAVARIGAGFGMTVLVHSPTRKSSEVPVEWVGLDDLWRRADVITLHCPLTDATRHLIRAETIARMKPDVRLINTGRGDLVDEVELERALRSGRVAGFGGDVLSTEPPAAGHPLFTAPNAIITPHVAWASVEARRRLMDILVENVRAFLAGHPVNVVN